MYVIDLNISVIIPEVIILYADVKVCSNYYLEHKIIIFNIQVVILYVQVIISQIIGAPRFIYTLQCWRLFICTTVEDYFRTINFNQHYRDSVN